MTDDWAPGAGDIIWLEFDPTVGTEQSGRRPGLVLSERSYNHPSGRVLVMPISSRARDWPFEVALVEGAIRGVVLVDQVRVVDWRARYAKPAGRADSEVLRQARAKLAALAGD